MGFNDRQWGSTRDQRETIPRADFSPSQRDEIFIPHGIGDREDERDLEPGFYVKLE